MFRPRILFRQWIVGIACEACGDFVDSLSDVFAFVVCWRLSYWLVVLVHRCWQSVVDWSVITPPSSEVSDDFGVAWEPFALGGDVVERGLCESCVWEVFEEQRHVCFEFEFCVVCGQASVAG